jgi:hypothetical protein
MIIHETRWKCDYCGAVSPIVGHDEIPAGWMFYQPFLAPSDRKKGVFTVMECYIHFCCMDHQNKWLTEQRAKSQDRS